ncbi:UNVERIFIED_CONTAM: hypothetical protein Sradi_5321600 [Sesamum radiatum]|uniref:Transmembrane protein n=1 Tax=Sesamum radiatum TaxID=300843 RepID=A0AAW2LQY9_SESRA
MMQLPAGEVVRTKVVRLLYFVGAGGTCADFVWVVFVEAVCAAAINKWKDMERKSLIRKYQRQLNGSSSQSPSNVLQKSS